MGVVEVRRGAARPALVPAESPLLCRFFQRQELRGGMRLLRHLGGRPWVEPARWFRTMEFGERVRLRVSDLDGGGDGT